MTKLPLSPLRARYLQAILIKLERLEHVYLYRLWELLYWVGNILSGVSGPKAEGEKKSRRRKEGDAGGEEAAAEEEEEESEPEEIVETTSTFGAFTVSFLL